MPRMLTRSLLFLAALPSLGAAVPYQKDNMGPNGPLCSLENMENMVKVGSAVYFLTNDVENAVVALPIGKDGLLSKGTVTKTCGAGSIAINGATKKPGLPDALLAQSSLTVAGNVSPDNLPISNCIQRA